MTGLNGHPDLADPPVKSVDLDLLKEDFDQWIIKADRGGALANAHKHASRATVVSAMNKDASYVDINCDEDLTILLSSGFEAVSTNRAQSVLNAPVIVGVVHGPQTGEMKLRVKGDPNRKAIQGRSKALGGEFGPVITFKNARDIVFDGMIAGTTYIMQLCGLGGSTGQSDWSEPVTKIAV
ncbi:MAG: hypothetical protein ABIY70_20640 [Capsulimonas sp.]|uniref:hypothetical protein n=1 Tax=Capsulimonas sp. TaxID=2494211 RepID=UPI0032677E9D